LIKGDVKQLVPDMAKCQSEGTSAGNDRATLTGNLLYPPMRTGPVVPAHPGNDQERLEAEREFLEDARFSALRAPEGAAFPS
jgi:hypothetical protein